MRRIRSGMGFGDALYLQSVVRHFVSKGETVTPCTAWPEVFSQLPVKTLPFTRLNVPILAHYSLRKNISATNQFQDCCIQAGIREPIQMHMDWKPLNLPLLDDLRAHGKPIVCVSLPRNPMGRKDGFGAALLPDCGVIQQAIDKVKDRALIVQIGSGHPLYKFTGIDVDLANKTTITDVLDIASIAHGFIGYCSFLIPLAESFSRPALIVWSERGTRCASQFIARITPKKILSKPSSRWVMDNQPQKLDEALDGFL